MTSARDTFATMRLLRGVLSKDNPHLKQIGTTIIVNLHHIHHCEVYCGRPSQWGNPFIIDRDGNRTEVLTKYGRYLSSHMRLVRLAKTELLGKSIGCFCLPLPCHLEILIGCAMEIT